MIRIYNTLKRRKEVLRPRKGKKVDFFVCGPTVYDYSHIGHARTYVAFDAFVKYLRKKKYNVFYLQNITDIDDKIIKRAKERKTTPLKLARKFEKEYLKEMRLLGIDAVSEYARATGHIKEIIAQVKALLEKGFAYITDDGIYYDTAKFKEYGKLSGRKTSHAEDGISRIDEGVKKKNKGDFCLWKFSKPGEPAWKSPWGSGRPGWHIEDTAISEKYFGPQYDIHGGARDLIFPHHEAEISQMEAVSGKKPFVKYWMHTGFLTVNGEKMSKSLGNFTTIRDFLEKHSPRSLRVLVLKSHYRSPIDYGEKNIHQIFRELERIDAFINKLEALSRKKIKAQKNGEIEKTEKAFEKALENDFDTPSFFAAFFNFITRMNVLIDKGKLSSSDSLKALNMLKGIDGVFGFIVMPSEKRTIRPGGKIPKKIREMAEERESRRRRGEWDKADAIREKVRKLGYEIEDAKSGFEIKRIN